MYSKNALVLFLSFSSWVHFSLPEAEGYVSPNHRLVRSSMMKIDRVDGNSPTLLHMAKKKKSKQDMEQINSWYDKVDDDATPDDVFWEEMERQKLLNDADSDDPPIDAVGSIGNMAASSSATPSSPPPASASNNPSPKYATNPSSPISRIPMDDKNADAILSSYVGFMVSDNWLDEKYHDNNNDSEDIDNWDDLDEQDHILNQQIDQLEKDRANGILRSGDSFSNEPWDTWGNDSGSDEFEIDMEKATKSDVAKQFLMTIDDFDNFEDDEETAIDEEQHLKRISTIQLKSRRLENARINPKAKAYFQRPVNEIEGFDQMWISAIDNACQKNLKGVFRNYGVEFADNFGDFEDRSDEDGHRTIEDIASFKARNVFEVTGLPCIASRTSFEIEPELPRGGADARGAPLRGRVNQRATSGYRFNDIGDHVDYIVEALKPLSEPTRVTRFRTCLCYYDGEVEIFEYGEVFCDIYFANSLRTFIPMSIAIDDLCKSLQLTVGLEYQKWMKKMMQNALGESNTSKARINLRDRVLKEGRVLPNDIIDVSDFMDSKIDVNLMDECASDLANRFARYKPTKILTVATTGLVIAIPMAKYLQVPVVYARKERSVVMSDTWQAPYSSKTMGDNRVLLVSKRHIDEDDRILIIDDFLSGGSSQEALLRIVSEAGATAVGVGVLVEKAYDAGRQALTGFDVPVKSLVRVASVKGGVITLVEEEGFSGM